jgi:putative Ca2+/H+ antiporter (TMEM165/GDT1 family)
LRICFQQLHGVNKPAFQACLPHQRTLNLATQIVKEELMDWKIFASTFVTIFLAEMGDKTQFAAMAASSETKSTLSVLAAVILALALAGSLGVLFGKFLGNVINPTLLKYISGTLFVLIGLWVLTSKN